MFSILRIAAVLLVACLGISATQAIASEMERVDRGTVVSVEIIRDQQEARGMSPGSTVGAVVGAAVGYRLGGSERFASSSVGGTLGAVVGRAFDARPARRYATVVAYPDGRAISVTTRKHPDVWEGQAVFVTPSGRLIPDRTGAGGGQ